MMNPEKFPEYTSPQEDVMEVGLAPEREEKSLVEDEQKMQSVMDEAQRILDHAAEIEQAQRELDTLTPQPELQPERETPESTEQTDGGGGDKRRFAEDYTTFKPCEACGGTGRRWLVFPCLACKGFKSVIEKSTGKFGYYNEKGERVIDDEIDLGNWLR